ncbi:GDP-mannose 4,6-dehydratase [bacterium]|nr:GDP-mannose 4,6-dehydratase [bacterium]
MKALVTGCAGFIGSTLVERLLSEGLDVIGIDSFTDYYERAIKERNLDAFRDHPRFTFYDVDVADFPFDKQLEKDDAVFHLAAQAGVRASWGAEFDHYTHNNITATQRLLERVKDIGLSRFVFAGSSSVYGDAESFPTPEDVAPAPISPYGMTKLASEHLCRIYRVAHGVPTVSLRYFTVFGPRQRPDMAFHRWCKAAVTGAPIVVYGDGKQTRDFTYVSDAVAATFAAMTAKDAVGEAINVGGGEQISVNDVIRKLEEIHGTKVERQNDGEQRGDVRHTSADVARAKRLLDYKPRVSVADGLEKEYAWIRRLYGA